ncbi:hypothetical protein ES703_38711 [subsurface metagenome]
MTYSPPDSTALHFYFTEIQWGVISFDFVDQYSPPGSTALHFDFTIVLFPIDFEFAPEVPPPISKDMLLALGIRYHGQVYKYWICQISHGTQQLRRYAIPKDRKTPDQISCRAKFAQAVLFAQELSIYDRLYWGKIGIRKKEPLPWFNAFIQAYMLDLVDPATNRHIRNLQFE